jgi:phosphate transport system protein
MRIEYHAELDDVSHILVAMAGTARTAMSQATSSLLEADATRAQEVISGDATVDELQARLEERVYGLLARQAPVASDLRLLFTALLIGADLERMGDLAAHVAKIGLRRHPFPAVPASLREVVTEMGAIADRIAAKIVTVLSVPDAVDAATLGLDDDEMDRLNEDLYATLLGSSWTDGVESAVDGAMLGRFYERYADHAVNAGRRLYFFVTGQVLDPPLAGPESNEA